MPRLKKSKNKQILSATKVRHFSIIAVAVIFGSVSTIVSQNIFAQKGGKNDYNATLSISPDPVIAGENFTVTGCGYKPDTGVLLSVDTPTSKAGFGGPADSDGCINITNWVSVEGSYHMTALQKLRKNDKYTVMAELEFNVVR